MDLELAQELDCCIMMEREIAQHLQQSQQDIDQCVGEKVAIAYRETMDKILEQLQCVQQDLAVLAQNALMIE